MKRFLRAILALCMCFAIVLFCAIPQAQAVGLGGILYNIAGNIGVNAALRAIGVGPGNSPEAFNNLVNDIANSEIINTAGQILVAGTTGDFKGFFQKAFLQGILDFMFDSGDLVSDSNLSLSHNFTWAGTSFSYTTSTPTICSLVYGPLDDGSGDFYGSVMLYGSSYFLVNSRNSSSKSSTSDLYFYRLFSASRISPSSLASFPGPVILRDMTNEGFESSLTSVSTDQDLTLGSVASSVDSSLYDSWIANGGTYDGGDYIPVSIPSLDASAISSQTQAQAQAGTIPDAVVEEIVAGSEAVPDTDTGTIAGVIDAIKALPQTLADLFTGIKDAVLSIPQAIADVFSPPAVSESYQISLSSFFPFCIPFDLYNLLDALAAAPEAPVINGVIPVPTFGQTYEIEVDLTPWDNVAALFRTLQLGLFIVGLALVTRERFLRS